MGLWKRFRNWRQGRDENTSPAEAPEQAMDEAIREMADALEKAGAHFAELTAYERQIRAEYDKNLQLSEQHEADARRHVLTGRDDLARHALQRKAEQDGITAEYRHQWEQHHDVMTGLQQQIEALTKQHRDAIRNRELLLVRQRASAAQNSVRQTLQTAQNLAPLQAVRDAEARSVAEAELDGLITARTTVPPIVDPDVQFAALREEHAPTPVPPALWFPDDPVEKAPQPIAPPVAPWFEDETVQTAPEPDPLWFEDEPTSQTEPGIANAIWFPQPEHGLPSETTLAPGANRALDPLPTDMPFVVSLGWQTERGDTTSLAACAILVATDDLARGLGDVVSAPQKRSSDGSIEQNTVPVPHPADNTVFTVQPETVPDDVQKVVFAVFIDDEQATRVLGQIAPSLHLRVLRGDTLVELASYLHITVEPDRALILAELYRYKGTWKVRALGQGFGSGLEAMLKAYGIGDV